MTTEEGNKIIAEFMDGVYSFSEKEYEWRWENCLIKTATVANLKYHSSWDWLMSVVEKIESITDDYHGHFVVYISSNKCTVQATNFKSDKLPANPPYYFHAFYFENKITSTWTAVIYFIQWYNSNKK